MEPGRFLLFWSQMVHWITTGGGGGGGTGQLLPAESDFVSVGLGAGQQPWVVVPHGQLLPVESSLRVVVDPQQPCLKHNRSLV